MMPEVLLIYPEYTQRSWLDEASCRF